MSNRTQRLAGKVAVVTGGSSGIGLAAARRLADEGAHVFVIARRQSQLEKAKAEIGTNLTIVQGDVSKIADLERLFAIVRERKGYVDVIFANAGGAWITMLGKTSEDDFYGMFDVNVKGVLFTVQTALPLLREGASIIIGGSMAGSKGFPGMTVYGAAKAAVRSFARTWAVELAERRIRTNVISPGAVDTPMMQTAGPRLASFFKGMIPMGRLGEPEEIAGIIAFLASDESSYINGIELFADGGAAQV